MGVGGTFGSYRIVEPLGSGAMGEVYKAVDSRMFDRPVAVKLLPERFATNSQAVERFRREIRLVANLRHPGVVTIHDHGEQEGRLYYVMEFIDGVKLSQVIPDATGYATGRRLDIGAQIAAGLQHIHQAGIVHRDLKPGNVMVSRHGARDSVKLLDFGIAQIAESDLTRAAAQPGTATYMSPEQARGEALDLRSDLFSLGIVLYELLSGVHPFAAASETLVTVSILQETPLPLSEIRPDLPGGVSPAVERLLAKEPGRRPGSASEIETVLLAAGDRLARDRGSETAFAGPAIPPTAGTVPTASTGPDLMDSAPTTMPELDAPTEPAPTEPVPTGPAATGPAAATRPPVEAERGPAPPVPEAVVTGTSAGGTTAPAPRSAGAGWAVWGLLSLALAAAGLVGWQMLGAGREEAGPAVLEPAAPGEQPEPAAVPDEIAIRDVLDRWRRAYEARDVDAILEVYPSLEDPGGMRLYFSRMEWLRVTTEQWRIDVGRQAEATAECLVGLRFLNVGATEPAEAALTARFGLARDAAGAWSIRRQDFVE